MIDKIKKFFKQTRKHLGSFLTALLFIVPSSGDARHQAPKIQEPNNTMKQTLTSLQQAKKMALSEVISEEKNVNPSDMNDKQQDNQQQENTSTSQENESSITRGGYVPPPPQPAQESLQLSTDGDFVTDLTMNDVMQEAELIMTSSDTNLMQAKKGDEFKKAYEENLLVLQNKITHEIYTVDRRNHEEMEKYKMQLLSGSIVILNKDVKKPNAKKTNPAIIASVMGPKNGPQQ